MEQTIAYGVAFASGFLVDAIRGELGTKAVAILRKSVRRIRDPLQKVFEESMDSLKQIYPQYSLQLEKIKKEWTALKISEVQIVGKERFLEALRSHGISDISIGMNVYESFGEEFRKSFSTHATRGNLEDFSLYVVREFEEARLDREEEIELLKSLFHLSELGSAQHNAIQKVLDILLSKMDQNVKVNSTTLETLNQFMLANTSSPPFRYDLDEIAFRLVKASTISHRISDDDKQFTLDAAKSFKNVWQYGQYLAEIQSDRKKMLFAGLRRISDCLDNTDEEIRLKIILALLSADFASIEKLSLGVKDKLDPEARRIKTLSKEILMVEALFDHHTETAKGLLADMKETITDAQKTELLFSEFMLTLSNGISEDEVQDLLGISKELESCRRDENAAFIAGLLSATLLFLGKRKQAQEILDIFQVSMYFPDWTKFNQIAFLASQSEFENVKPLLLELVISSGQRWVREWAQLGLLGLEARENPKKAVDDLDKLIKSSKPRGDFLARCLLLKSNILRKIGYSHDAEELVNSALQIVENMGLDFSSASLKADILLEKGFAFYVPRGDFLGLARIIDEVKRLPLSPNSRITLSYLQCILAMDNKDLDEAERIMHELIGSKIDVKSRLRFVPGMTMLGFMRNAVPQTKERLVKMLDEDSLLQADRVCIFFFLADLHHRVSDYKTALYYYDKAYENLELDSRTRLDFVMLYSSRLLNLFLNDMFTLKLGCAQRANDDMDFKKAWEILNFFPSFLNHSLISISSDTDKEHSVHLALTGCCMRAFLLDKFGQTESAYDELDALLRLDLRPKERALVLLYKIDIEMNYDANKAQEDLEKAGQFADAWVGKSSILLRQAKLLLQSRQFGKLAHLNTQIFELKSAEEKVVMLHDLGFFLLQQKLGLPGVFYLRKGLELSKEITDPVLAKSSRRQFLFQLGNFYAENRPETALQLIRELEREQPGSHETIMLNIVRAKALTRLERFEEADKALRCLGTVALNEVESHVFLQIAANLQFARKDWKEVLAIANRALKSESSNRFRSEFVLRKVYCALELSNTLMALDLLETLKPDELADVRKAEYYTSYQRALLSDNRETDATGMFQESLARLSERTRMSCVTASFELYKNVRTRVSLLEYLYASMEKSGLNVDGFFLLLKLMLMSVDNLNRHDFEKNANLLMIYALAKSEKEHESHPPRQDGEAKRENDSVEMTAESPDVIISDCVKRGLSPEFLKHFVLSIISLLDGKSNDAVIHASKSFELNKNDPLIGAYYLGSLIENRQFELAETLGTEMTESPILGTFEPVHTQLMRSLLAQRKYELACKEQERWILFHPFDNDEQAKLAATCLLNGRYEEARRQIGEILDEDAQNRLAVSVQEIINSSDVASERKSKIDQLLNGIYFSIARGFVRLGAHVD